MKAMAARMQTALETAEKDQQPLSFVVFVPGWSDEPSWLVGPIMVYSQNTFSRAQLKGFV